VTLRDIVMLCDLEKVKIVYYLKDLGVLVNR
jgi:hypothetical protein